MTRALPIVFLIGAGLCLALVLLWLWQSLRHLLLGRRALAHAGLPHDPRRAALLREKQELLTAIRDVRAEHELGKVSAADFERLEQGYRARARDVLRELEAQVAPHREKARLLLQKALEAPSSTPSAAASVPSDAPASAPPSDAPASASRVACAECGAGNEPDALFCKKCGARLRSEATA